MALQSCQANSPAAANIYSAREHISTPLMTLCQPSLLLSHRAASAYESALLLCQASTADSVKVELQRVSASAPLAAK